MESPLEYALGIDIGGTTTKYGIVNHRGEIFSRGDLSSRQANVEDFIEELYQALQPAIKEMGGIEFIKGIGVGAPNGNYYKGTIEYAPNLRWRGIIPIADLISKKIQSSMLTYQRCKCSSRG